MLKISKKNYRILMKALYREREETKGLEGFKNGLNEFQQEAIKAYKDPNITTIFGAAGRKCGKTHLVCIPIWEMAVSRPGSHILYVAPTRADAENIVWRSSRIQNFLGEEVAKHFIQKIDNRNLIIRLKNGSYIQLMGSERYENANGLSPDLIVYDEFKAFHPEFHRTMSMNKAAKGAKLILIGTKPDYLARNRTEYWAMYKQAKKGGSQKLIEAETFDNPLNHRPHIKKAILDDIEALRAAGREETIQREYYNKIIPGGKAAVFPVFSKEKHIMEHNKLMEIIREQYNELQFYQVMDPATTSVWGGLFIAYNPYTTMIYVMDEIYVKAGRECVTRSVFNLILSKAKDLLGEHDFQGTWFTGYDEAAAWAAGEILDQFNVYYSPTNKNANSKDKGISLILHTLGNETLIFSSRCVNTIEEILTMRKNEVGLIKKENDHNVDSLRYFYEFANYTVQKKPEPNGDKKDFTVFDVKSLESTLKDDLFDVDLDIDLDLDVNI